jgi:hypothetical protein
MLSDSMREPTDSLRESPADAVGAPPIAGLIRLLTAPWGAGTWLRVYAASIAMATFLTLTSALDSGMLPMDVRLGYWLTVILGGTLATQIVSLVVCRFNLDPLPEAVTLFVASTPGIVLTVWALTALYMGQSLQPANLPSFVVPVAVVTLALSVLHYLLNRRPRQSHVFPQALNRLKTDQPADQEPGGALRRRLPFKYRDADIYALSAEDHYLRVHTSAGEVMILMRLYDAIRELHGIEGSQTHRSWWVAKSAIAGFTKRNGRAGLTLNNGLNVPVSRAYHKVLKASHWL